MKSKRDREDERISKEVQGKVADLVLDLIKLIFAGVILAGILDISVDKVMLVLLGASVCLFLFVFWYILFIRSKRKD